MYVIDELKNYCTDSYENWYIYEFFHGEGLYNMLIDATRHQQLADLHLKHEKRRALRASESDEQRALRLENLRVHATETRSSESSDQREVRLETVIEYVLIRSVLLRELNYGKEGCKMFE
ncbi:hypothetical protein TNCV_66951 [Trichonephila clavipes]|nr:hypothetical protein TNCV_66951 [Trichonephila clavipes]